MKNVWRFAKIVIFTGCLVFLGLNAAAQGLEKMSPDISHGFLEFTSNNQVITVTALGREYHFDARGTLDTISYLKNRADQSTIQCKRSVVFWGNMLLDRGGEYFTYWGEKYRELIIYSGKGK